jgi:hypothetical protein
VSGHGAGFGEGVVECRGTGQGFGQLGEAQAILPLLRGGDVLGGDIGLDGVGRNEGGDAGDGGVVAAGQIVRAVPGGGGRVRRSVRMR